jgi:hypothetical protein
MSWQTTELLARATPEMIAAVGRTWWVPGRTFVYHGPGMPPEGLLIAPPPSCDKDEEPALPDIVTRNRANELTGRELEIYGVPSDGILNAVLRASRTIGQSIAYYHHETFGGATETEFAWILGVSPSLLVYDWQGTKAPAHVLEITPDSVCTIQTKMVLVELVRRFGGSDQFDGYLEPHTRGFKPQ